VLLFGNGLDVAPQRDRPPAIFGDATHQIGHEGDLGRDHGQAEFALDGEQRRDLGGILRVFRLKQKILRYILRYISLRRI
jgi:hypothetical protein